MTIKRKLNLLVFGQLIMFLLIIGISFLMAIPILTLNSEYDELLDLAEQTLVTRIELMGIISSPMQTQLENSKFQKQELDKKFKTVSEQKELIELNDNVKKAIESILRLQEMFNERWVLLEEEVNEVLEYSEQVMFTRMAPLLNFYKIKSTHRVDNFEYVMERVDTLERQVDIVDGALSSAYDVMITQYRIIQNAMNAKIKTLVIRILIIFLILVLIEIVIATRIASKMAGSVAALSSGVSKLREGRLDVQFSTSSRDDIAVLGDNLNEFTSELADSISAIKDSSISNVGMKNELSDAAGNAAGSSTQISEGINSIRDGMVDLDTKVSESGTAVNTVNARTEELKGMLQDQTAMIEESTSSVTEMIASIANVNEITGKKKAATDELVRTAETGGNKLGETLGIIQQITSNVDEIRSTTSIIQTVAAQTSLLAMNAAIEAAHAGDAGAGFSVVAEEIRKLADASGASSKRIGAVLKEVVGNIEDAAVSGEETRRAFSDINQEVVDVASALDEISTSMSELSAGGSQILSAMTSLQGATGGVIDGSSAMTDAAASLESAFRLVERVTSSVLSQIGGISSRIEEIGSATAVVNDISGRLSIEAERLDAEVSRFQLEAPAEPDDRLPAEPVVDETAD